MNSDIMIDAIGMISDSVILDAKEYEIKASSFRKRRFIAVLAAVMLALALSVTALAAAGALHGVLGWFGNLWESATGKVLSEAQARTIMDLTGAVGASAEDNGVTVTAKSVTLGDSSAVLLFAVSIDNTALSADSEYSFDTFWCDVGELPGDRGVSQSFYKVDTAANEAYIIVKYDGGLPTADIMRGEGVMTVRLGGLVERGAEGAVLREGQWEFEIALDPDLLPASIYVESAKVQGRAFVSDLLPGMPVSLEIRDISITSTGISFAMDAGYEGGWSITAVLTDGTKVRTSTGSGYLMPDEKTYSNSFVWEVPISLSELDYIGFYGARLQVGGE